MLAAFFKAPELMLDEQESAMLASAAQSVQDFYDFETSAEVLLWMNVAGTLAAVYGPRVMTIGMRSKKTKANKPKADPEPSVSPAAYAEGFLVPHHAPSE